MAELEQLTSDTTPLLLEPKNRKATSNISRWAALIVGCMCFAAVGSKYAFNVYQNDLKSTFNYTQSEVAVMASMLILGGGVYIVPGAIFDRFGPLCTSFAGLILMGCGYFLIWSTTRTVEFYRTKSWLQYIYFLTTGLGSSFIYLAALNTNMYDFPPKTRSTIAGVLNAFLMGSYLLYIILYYKGFGSQQRYSGIMMLFLVLSVVTGLLSLIFLRTRKEGNNNIDKREQKSFSSSWPSVHENSHGNTSPLENNVAVTKEPKDKVSQVSHSLRLLMKDVDFLLFCTVLMIMFTTTTAFITNITTTTKSMQFNEYEIFLLSLTPLVNLLTSVINGYLYSKVKSPFRKSLFAVVPSIACILSGTLSTFAADNLTSFFIAVGANALAAAMLFTSGIGHLATVVGPDCFGIVFGIVATITMSLVFGLQAAFGALYDAEVNFDLEYTCHGLACVQGGYGLLLGVQVIGLTISLVLAARSRSNSQTQ